MTPAEKLRVASWNFGSVGDDRIEAIDHSEEGFDSIDPDSGWHEARDRIEDKRIAQACSWLAAGWSVSFVAAFAAFASPQFDLADTALALGGLSVLSLIGTQLCWAYCYGLLSGMQRISALWFAIQKLHSVFWLGLVSMRFLVPKWMPVRFNPRISNRASYEVRSGVLHACLTVGLLRAESFADGVYESSRLARAGLRGILDGLDLYYNRTFLLLGSVFMLAPVIALDHYGISFLVTLPVYLCFFFWALIRYFRARVYLLALAMAAVPAAVQCIDATAPPVRGGFLFRQEICYGIAMILPICLATIKLIRTVSGG